MGEIKIAVLGSNGHIAKALLFYLLKDSNYKLTLYSTSLKKVTDYLHSQDLNHLSKKPEIYHTSTFPNNHYDVVINCIGIGNPQQLLSSHSPLFEITETYDNIILSYLKTHKSSLYINMSSGAVYGATIEQPIDAAFTSQLNVNDITVQDFYRIAKIHSEAKHRSLSHLNIIDLRVFSFFSSFIGLDTRFLITDIINCLRNNTVLVTSESDMTRDYIHPKDLYSLIQQCINNSNVNTFYDVYSLKPISKWEIINYFSEHWNLQYRTQNSDVSLSPTGRKAAYFSNNPRAKQIGFVPVYTSLDTIHEEATKIFNSDSNVEKRSSTC